MGGVEEFMFWLATGSIRDVKAESASAWLFRRRGRSPIKKTWWACFHKRHAQVMRDSPYVSISRMATRFDVRAAREAMDSITSRCHGATP